MNFTKQVGLLHPCMPCAKFTVAGLREGFVGAGSCADEACTSTILLLGRI